MNRLGVIKAQENTRRSDCIHSGVCFYVPVVNSTAVHIKGREHSSRAESAVFGVSSLGTPGWGVKPIFKSQALCDSITI